MSTNNELNHVVIDEHALLDNIRWNEQGLITAIAQDHIDNTVLMIAWMNREALLLSIQEQRAVYWSRSRQSIWRKGESSGHIQHLKDIYLDCDNDAILMKVDQVGDKACHTGRRSCFFNHWQNNAWNELNDE